MPSNPHVNCSFHMQTIFVKAQSGIGFWDISTTIVTSCIYVEFKINQWGLRSNINRMDNNITGLWVSLRKWDNFKALKGLRTTHRQLVFSFQDKLSTFYFQNNSKCFCKNLQICMGVNQITGFLNLKVMFIGSSDNFNGIHITRYLKATVMAERFIGRNVTREWHNVVTVLRKQWKFTKQNITKIRSYHRCHTPWKYD